MVVTENSNFAGHRRMQRTEELAGREKELAAALARVAELEAR